jgi:hypothetical protein
METPFASTQKEPHNCAETRRLKEEAERKKNWKRWGPYLAERQVLYPFDVILQVGNRERRLQQRR